MAQSVTAEYVKAAMGDRPADSHKGRNGRGLLLSGSPGMSGAALMCSAAALRAGIGTLKVLSTEMNRQAFCVLPEAMVSSVTDWDNYPKNVLYELICGADCIAAGPGMGKAQGVITAVCSVVESGKPLVIDADGLNALAAAKERPVLHEQTVLTPHIGEMARLTGAPTSDIAADAEGFAKRYAEKWGCTVLLKSAKSVIAEPGGRVMINCTGNPGLAKGGSGDVLCGITLALLGQGLSPFDSACAAAYILGTSADEAAALLNIRMLMARDVIDIVRQTTQHLFTD